MERELAKKFMDGVLYGCGFIDRLHPFNEEIHYGDWTEKFEKELNKIVPELGVDFFTDDFIDMFTDGDEDVMKNSIDEHPCLETLNQMINDYYDWLCENVE